MPINGGFEGRVGELDRLLADSRKSQDILGDREPSEQLVTKLALEARLYAEYGHLSLGWERLRLGEEIQGDSKEPFGIATLATSRGFLHLLEGDLERGLEESEVAIEGFRKLRGDLMLTYAQNIKANILMALNRPQEALDVVDESMPFLEMNEVRVRPQANYFTKYLALSEMGREEEARQALESARDWLVEVAGNIKDEQVLECWLEKIPVNIRIADEARALGLMD